MKTLPFYQNLDDHFKSLLSATRLKNPKYYPKKDELLFELHRSAPLSFEDYQSLQKVLSEYFSCKTTFSLVCDQSWFDPDLLRPYLQQALQQLPNLSKALFEIGRKIILIVDLETTDKEKGKETEKEKEISLELAKLKQMLKDKGFIAEIELREKKVHEKAQQQREELLAQAAAREDMAKEMLEQRESQQRQAAIRKKAIKGEPIAIKEAEPGMSNVILKGHIFDLDTITFKNGTMMQRIWLSDYDEAILCKRFENKKGEREEFDAIKPGMQVLVQGNISYDTFEEFNTLTIRSLEILPDEKPRADRAENKRVEFHVHTNFSEMDGISSASDYIQRAFDWGMPAIAISDHNVIQAFPEAYESYRAIKKAHPEADFNVIYGVEMNALDPHYDIVLQNDHRTLEQAEFIVFDTETTGLSARRDRIIEFGAVRIADHGIEESYQFFIDPERPIPENISNLTHIRPGDVKDAGNFKAHYNQIKEIFKDRILVAHNASFDLDMLNSMCELYGLEPFDNPVIDTRDLAQAMFTLRNYRLESLSKHYGEDYQSNVAHRADYDARILAYDFLHMLEELKEIRSLDDFEKLDHSSALWKKHPYHIGVYAKNDAGLKELYELITLSHTDYLAYNPATSSANITGQPRIPLNILQDYHKKGNLLFGSSCQNSYLFEMARNKTKKQLLEAMDLYDFIEIQPPAVYANLLQPPNRAFENKEALLDTLSFIDQSAREKGKLVIASGDVHYLDFRQKRIREIYINAKQIGGGRHPLYTYSDYYRKLNHNPDQAFLTTDEMLQSFSFLGKDRAREIVVENTRKLAKEFKEVHPLKDKLYPPSIEGADEKLKELCYQKAYEMYGNPLPEPIAARLEKELNAIISAGYYVVYYISHLLVKKSNEDGYLVGSRGSVGSSFVATMAGITEVNPLPAHYYCPNCHYLEWADESVSSGYDLPEKSCPKCGHALQGDGQNIPFETFLGFEGDKVPDIDLNFSGDYQGTAHNFTKEIFGADHVFRAGTVGTVQEKTAYGYVRSLEESKEENFNEAKRKDMAKEAAGVKRTTGQHPGGIVVVPKEMDIHDFTPVQYPANNPTAEWKTTHFDFSQIHDNILKFDILGHVDPTAMKMLERLWSQKEGKEMDVRTIPMNDPETMKLFSSIEPLGLPADYPQSTGAAGLPEFGTQFVRGILESTRPKTFSELVSISGLSHGTDVWLNNAADLIDQGICNIGQVIGCRDDIMLNLIGYGLESKLAFTIMESVRKGRGLKPEWEKAMVENKVPAWYIDSCKKIKYMFPKAHAVAYVMMAVRIAWFKVHKPLFYYCQFFTMRCDAYELPTMQAGKEKIQARMNEIRLGKERKDPLINDKMLQIYDTLELALEMTSRGFGFSPINIHKSQAQEFIIDPDNENNLLPPFSAVDGLGEMVAKSIVEAREEEEFLSIEDLMERTSLSKTLIERLSDLGALEGLQEHNQMSLF